MPTPKAYRLQLAGTERDMNVLGEFIDGHNSEIVELNLNLYFEEDHKKLTSALHAIPPGTDMRMRGNCFSQVIRQFPATKICCLTRLCIDSVLLACESSMRHLIRNPPVELVCLQFRGKTDLSECDARRMATLLCSLEKLKHLEMGGCDYGACGAQHLAGSLIHLRGLLEHLGAKRALQCGLFSDNPGTLLETLKTLTQLRHLDLTGNCLNGSDLMVGVARSLRSMQQLQTLRLGSNHFGPAGMEALSVAIPSSVRVLDLHNTKISKDGSKSLSQTLHRLKHHLEILNLGYCDLGASGMQQLSGELVGCSKMVELTLCKNGLGDEGGCMLASVLMCMAKMVRLNVSGNNIHGEGARRMQKVLTDHSSMLNLRVLDVSDNSMDVLLFGGGVPSLRVLELQNTNIGSIGSIGGIDRNTDRLRMDAFFSDCRNLKKINVEGCTFYPGMLKSLVQAVQDLGRQDLEIVMTHCRSPLSTSAVQNQKGWQIVHRTPELVCANTL